MQTTTEHHASGQSVEAYPTENVVIVPQYVTSPPESPIWANYASKSSVILGLTQMVIGVLCVLCNVVAIVARSTTAVVGHGIWGGLFFMLTGAFGVMAGKKRTTCPIIAFMTLSIPSASFFVIIILIIASIGAGVNCDTNRTLARRMDLMMVSLSLLEAVVAIWSLAFCCHSFSYGHRAESDIAMQQRPAMMSADPTQVVYTTGTSYPQTGQMFQQQAIGQQQQFCGAPTNHVPQKMISYPPQAAMPPPPQYTVTADAHAPPQGTADGPNAPMSKAEQEHKTNAL